MAHVIKRVPRTKMAVKKGQYFPIVDRTITVRKNSECNFLDSEFGSDETAKAVDRMMKRNDYEYKFLICLSESTAFPDFVRNVLSLNVRSHMNEYSGKSDANNANLNTPQDRFEFAEIKTTSLDRGLDYFVESVNTGFSKTKVYGNVELWEQNAKLVFQSTAIAVRSRYGEKPPSTFRLSDDFKHILGFLFRAILTYFEAIDEIEILKQIDDYAAMTPQDKEDHIFINPTRLNAELSVTRLREALNSVPIDKNMKTEYFGQFVYHVRTFFNSFFDNYAPIDHQYNFAALAKLTYVNFIYPSLVKGKFTSNSAYECINNFSVFEWALANLDVIPEIDDILMEELSSSSLLEETATLMSETLKSLPDYSTVKLNTLRNYLYIKTTYDRVRGLPNSKNLYFNTDLSAPIVMIKKHYHNYLSYKYSEKYSNLAKSIFKDININDKDIKTATADNFITNIDGYPRYYGKFLKYAILGNCAEAEFTLITDNFLSSYINFVSNFGAPSIYHVLTDESKNIKNKYDSATVLKDSLSFIEEIYKNYKDENDLWFVGLTKLKSDNGITLKSPAGLPIWTSYPNALTIQASITAYFTSNAILDANKASDAIYKIDSDIGVVANEFISFYDSVIEAIEIAIKTVDPKSAFNISKIGSSTLSHQEVLDNMRSAKAYFEKYLASVTTNWMVRKMSVVKLAKNFPGYLARISYISTVHSDLIKEKLGVKGILVLKMRTGRDPQFTNYALSNSAAQLTSMIYSGEVDSVSTESAKCSTMLLTGDSSYFSNINATENSLIHNKHDFFRSLTNVFVNDRNLPLKEIMPTERKYIAASLKLTTMRFEKDVNSKLFGVLTIDKKRVLFKKENIGLDFKTLAPKAFSTSYNKVSFQYEDINGATQNFDYTIPTWSADLQFTIENSDCVIYYTPITRLSQVIGIIYQRLLNYDEVPGGRDLSYRAYVNDFKGSTPEATLVTNLFKQLKANYELDPLFKSYFSRVFSNFSTLYRAMDLDPVDETVLLGIVFSRVIANILHIIYNVDAAIIDLMLTFVNPTDLMM